MDTYSNLVSSGGNPVGDNTLAGGGEMGHLMREQNWAASPLGDVSHWPQSLRTAVSICLSSRFPIIIFWGTELRQFYNDAYRPILGTSKHPRALGQRARDCWPEVWEAIGPMLRGVLSTGEATWSENLLLPLERNGYAEECYFTFSYSPIRDERGEVGGVFCAVTETTGEVLGKRRMHALQKLATATIQAGTPEEVCQRAATLLANHSADVPMALLYLLSAHDHSAVLAGTSGIEAGSLASPARIALSDLDVAWPLVGVVQSGQVEQVNDLDQRFGGFSGPLLPGAEPDQIPKSALVLPIVRPGDERPYGFLIAGISPRRPLDEDYRGFFTLIAGQIANAITTVRAYQDARERAAALEELDAAKTAFFSNVSHEFRTPLTLMLGPLESLLADTEHPLTPDQREQVALARRNGLRQLKLVNSLLDFLRIEAGRLEAVSTPTDLARLTIDLASAFRSTIENAGITFKVDCPPLPERISIDRGMWEKIIFNLLSNAFKFTFQGMISVSLRIVDDTILLSVADTGIGISQEDLPHLFERFYRAGGNSARSLEGTGIGLSLVQELVRFYHGTISVESVVGQGTTFTVRLPAADPLFSTVNAGTAAPTRVSTTPGAEPYIEEAARWLLEPELNPAVPAGEQNHVYEHEESGDPRPGAGQVYRLLVVDDNADMRQYLKRLLSPFYQVQLAADGLGALALARATLPDLIISDVMMPALDGFGLLAALRAELLTKAIPFIALSARAGEEATLQGLAAGAEDYLVKPFSARELLARVRAQLEISRLRREASNRARELETIFDAMVDGVVVTDLQGTITRTNQAFNHLFGFENALAVLRLPEERARLVQPRRLDGTVLPREEWPLDQALKGKQCNMDLLGSSQSGEEIIFNASSAPLRDVNGQIMGAMAVYRDVTEHRSLENRLRVAEREARLQAQQRLAIFEALADSLTVYDADGNLVYLNAATWVQIGTTPDTSYDKGPLATRFSLLQPSDLAGAPLPIEAWPQSRILRGEVLSDVNAVELVLYALDGQVRTVSMTGAPMYDAQEKIIGGVLISRDITESRLLEDALRRERRAFQMVAENAPDIIVRYDRELRHIYANPVITRATGLSPEEYVGKTNQETGMSQELLDRSNAALSHVFTLGQPTIFEYSRETPTGLRYYQANIAPELDEQGNVVSALVVSHDVTELMANQQRMQEAFTALLTVAEALVTNYESPVNGMNKERTKRDTTQQILDAISKVLTCKGAAMTVLAPASEIIQEIVMKGFEPEIEQATLDRALGKSLSERINEPSRIERLRQGEFVRLDFNQPGYEGRRPGPGITQTLLVPMRLRGELAGIITLYPADPYYQYTLEELTLAESIGKLAAVLIERERLLKAREEAWASALAAREITKQMDEFIGIVSHELKTPLTTVKGNLQLAKRQLMRLYPQRKTDVSKQEEILAIVQGFVERAEQQIGVQNRLVNDLIDVSRIRADKLKLQVEECDLAQIVQEVISDQRALNPARIIRLDSPAAEVPVLADSERIGQVLNNYLSNALKYSESSRPVIVQLLHDDEDGMARVLVSDEGAGLSEQQQQHIWERFYRAPGIEVKSGSGVGLGLGLHICRTLIERQGGQVGVQSSPGKGSTFWFILPPVSS